MSEDTLTVVLARPTASSCAVGETLDTWVRAGIVAPLVWTTVEGEVTRGTWLGGAHGAEADLRAVIAAHPYRLVRLVAVHVVAAGEGSERGSTLEFIERAHHLQLEVARALAPHQQLLRLNVLIPASDARDVSLETLSLQAQANVLVAPEQRISPRHASVEVVGEQLVAHAAAAVASISGCWRAAFAGPFDEEHHQGSAGTPQVTVVRSFGRVLQIRGALGEVAEQLFTSRRTRKAVMHGIEGAPARDAQGLVAGLLGDFLARYGDRFAFVPRREPERPRGQSVRILAAFLAMFRYIATGLRDLPGALISRTSHTARQQLSQFAQRVTFGHDSLMEVSFGGRPSDRRDGDADPTRAMTDLAQDLLAQVSGRAPTPPAAGDAWRALRRVCLASMDGSSMPEGVREPRDGATREVLTDAYEVAPDPRPGAFQFSEVPAFLADMAVLRAPIRVCDALQVREVRQALEAARTIPAGDEAEDPDTRSSQDERATTVARLERELDTWVAARQGGLLWQLATKVGDAFTSAQSELRRSLERVREGEARLDEAELARAQRRLRRRWLATTLIMLALGGLAYWAYERFGLEATTTLTAASVATWVLLWLASLLLFFVRYQRRLFQIKYAYDQQHAKYLDALERAPDSASQVVGLQSIYGQLRDWAEVIGWMVHHPEGPWMPMPQVPAAVADLELPPSVVVTEGQAREESRQRVGTIVGRRVFRRGWLVDLYDRYSQEAVIQLKYDHGLSSEDPDPDPDWDLSWPTPLGSLLSHLATGTSARAWTQEVIEELVTVMRELPPAEIITEFEGQPERTTDAETFLTEVVPEATVVRGEEMAIPLWSSEARLRETGRVAHSLVWGPPGLAITDAHGVTQLVGGASRPPGDVLVLECVRLDMTDAAAFGDLTIFGSEELAPAAVAERPVDGVW